MYYEDEYYIANKTDINIKTESWLYQYIRKTFTPMTPAHGHIMGAKCMELARLQRHEFLYKKLIVISSRMLYIIMLIYVESNRFKFFL